MKVSIVTTVYNHRDFLRQQVQYVRKQTLTDFEWYMIDDCSPDGSYELLQSLCAGDERIHLIQNEKNEGFGSIGLDRVLPTLKGEYLYKIDGDDLPAPNFLKVMVDALDQRPEVSMGSARCLYMDENDRVWGRRYAQSYALGQGEFYSKLACGNFLGAPGLLYRMKHIQDTIGFSVDRSLRSKDWYMNLRMALRGGLYRHGEALACYRQHANNWSKIAFRTANWEHVFGSSFVPILLSFDQADKMGQSLPQELREAALTAAGRMCWMVHQKVLKSGGQTDEAAFREGIRRYCPGFNFSQDYTGKGWRQYVIEILGRFAKRPVNSVFPLTS